MSVTTRHLKFTYEDYLLFPEDGKRHELIDGEHHMTPAPNIKHQRISGNLLVIVRNFLKRCNVGQVFDAPTDVVFSEFDVVQPDLLFVSSGRSSIMSKNNIQGAPDLIIEILSETTRKTDEIIKRKLYERYGVAEYWLVDPELESVKVYRTVQGTYARVAELTRETDTTLTTPLLPDLAIPLTEIFE